MPTTEKTPVVLCVDDEAPIRSALRRVFLEEPWELVLADSGATGLEVVREREVDVVLSDFRMPGTDGVSFLAEVRKIRPHCVRIILSGYADINVIVTALNEGEIYRFVSKPWNDAELRDNVRKALDHHQLRIRSGALHARLERQVSECQQEIVKQDRALRLAVAILNGLPLPVVGVDEQGAVVLANRAARDRGALRETDRADGESGAAPFIEPLRHALHADENVLLVSPVVPGDDGEGVAVLVCNDAAIRPQRADAAPREGAIE